MRLILLIVLSIEQICSMKTKIKDNKEPILFPNDVETTNEEHQQLNQSKEFEPSAHLGEIEEEGSKTQLMNPFNDLQHIKFDNTVDVEKDSDARIKFIQNSNDPHQIKQQVVFYETPQSYDNFEKPKQYHVTTVPDFHHFYQHGYHPPSLSQGSPYENLNNPENTILYKHESLFTRTRKFPYQFFQPNHVHHSDHHLRVNSASPWKKIVHLIGAVLPLGLLLASLTPNVLKIENTTQPTTVVLSKLRVVDLPVEHKQSNIRPHQNMTTKTNCEDKSICELIMKSGNDSSDLLKTVLWNIATNTSDRVARLNGLGEIFNAVKKKNCELIVCQGKF